MKSRVFTFISLLALVVAMVAAGSATAQTTPAQDVYNPSGEVLDVVSGGGNDTTPADTVPTESGQSICSEADGLDVNGNAVTKGSAADCSDAVPASVCAAADGRDASGNSVAYGSAADCATATPTVSEGELPFTGFQAGLVALAGFGLLGAGFAMRRVSRNHTA